MTDESRVKTVRSTNFSLEAAQLGTTWLRCPGTDQRRDAGVTITERESLVVIARGVAERLLAVFVDEDKKMPLEPFGVVDMEGPPKGTLPVDELILVSVALVAVATDRPEALADLQGRARRLSGVRKCSEQLETQRPIVGLEEFDRLTERRLRQYDPVALEKLGDA